MKVILIFINFLSTLSVLPNWNLKNSSKILLDSSSTSDTYTYTVTHRAMYKLEAELKKTITRLENKTLTHQNELFINKTSYGKVTFEHIESFYKTDSNNRYICPIGKYDPINLDGMSQITNDITKNNIWDLKCYNHNSGKIFFFVFYLMNGANQIYDLVSGTTYNKYNNLQLQSELNNYLYI